MLPKQGFTYCLAMDRVKILATGFEIEKKMREYIDDTKDYINIQALNGELLKAKDKHQEGYTEGAQDAFGRRMQETTTGRDRHYKECRCRFNYSHRFDVMRDYLLFVKFTPFVKGRS
ncbi:hypothetical protein Tco_1303767 [Tanacetum coccineum]